MEKSRMVTSTDNAPNRTTGKTVNLGGKTEIEKHEGGTLKEEEAKEAKLPPHGVVEKDGVKTFISGENEESLTKTKEVAEKDDSGFFNHTASLTGVSGQVNLTQGGKLNSDKSMRADRSLEEINKELEDKAGPNPTPNRDGNEITKATMGIGASQIVGVDFASNAMADDIKDILKKGSLDDEGKQKLTSMEENLRMMGKV